MNNNQQTFLDVLTGMGILSGELFNIRATKKKVTGSIFDVTDGTEGDFTIKTNKKGFGKKTGKFPKKIGNIPQMFRICFPETSQTCPGHSANMSWKRPGNVLETSWAHP